MLQAKIRDGSWPRPTSRTADERPGSPLPALTEALEARHGDLARHGRAVARHCVATARELGLAAATVERLRVAGVLHDVGKVGISDRILQKPGPLSREEWQQVRCHPQIGARLLSSSTLDEIAGWVLAHHERPDGRGYPFGLRGQQIPLPARILAIADAYDAMRSDRAYRSAMTSEEAAGELRRGAGEQFDADVVAAFLRALDRTGDASL